LQWHAKSPEKILDILARIQFFARWYDILSLSLSEGITRRRFIKRTGVATVGTVLALRSMRVHAAILADCTCFTFTVPPNGFDFNSSNPSVQNVKDQLTNAGVPFKPSSCGSRGVELAPGNMRIDSVPEGDPLPKHSGGVFPFPAGTTWRICVKSDN
jgi:hypothetical protein